MSLFGRNETERSSSEMRPEVTMSRSRDRTSISKKSHVLPVLLPPSSLRPVTFRIFTKKHNLTVNSTSLQLLATFIGKNCGSGWREDGLAEPVLDEIAKTWKASGGGVIVDDNQKVSLESILRNLENNMSGGKVVHEHSRNRPATHTSVPNDTQNAADGDGSGSREVGDEHQSSPSNTRESMPDYEEPTEADGGVASDPGKWLKIVSAFEHPRLLYNVQMKHFEQSSVAPSLLPPPSHKAAVFRDRYHVIYQRLVRNEAFQSSTSASFRQASTNQNLNLTSIANLQGRSGSSHLLMGLLSISPTGDISLTDPTGTTVLDLRHAKTVPEGGSWVTPGMIVIVDGVYEEEGLSSGSGLAGATGIGGAIGGKFIGFSVGGPPCERRDVSLGINDPNGGGAMVGRGFGWTDFLGVGSECMQGPRMRQIENQQKRKQSESQNNRNKVIMLSEVNLDLSRTTDAVKSVLNYYSALPAESTPAVFLMIGNFVSQAVIGEHGTGGSIEYKENFNNFASILSEYPHLLRNSTFIFVPGDNDLWASSFSAGATAAIPKMPIPEMFTSRIQRAFNSAINDSQSPADHGGKAIWTTNPTRLSIFGPVHEFAVFRDDISGRVRRTSLTFGNPNKPDGDTLAGDNSHEGNGMNQGETQPIGLGTQESDQMPQQRESLPPTSGPQKLVKTVLDQGCLSPFPLSVRPTLWNYTSALQLYPLPTALVLADPETEPYAITYEGCHVMNPGKLVPDSNNATVRWIEYDIMTSRGQVREKQGL